MKPYRRHEVPWRQVHDHPLRCLTGSVAQREMDTLVGHVQGQSVRRRSGRV